MHTSICMITYNKLPFLVRSLKAITGSVSGDVEVELIVLDNGCTDGTTEYLEAFSNICPATVDFKWRRQARNVGLNGYGLIVPEATGKVIVTADDDIFEVCPPGWERRFGHVLFNKFGGRTFGYVGTDTINDDGGRAPEEASLGFARLGDLEIEVGPAGGWFTATTKEVISRVGGFHTNEPRMHLEDADFQGRAWAAGYLVGTLLNTRVLHARSPHYYVELGCENTYLEKSEMAKEVGIRLERIA